MDSHKNARLTPAGRDSRSSGQLQTNNRDAAANGRVDRTVTSMLHYGSGGNANEK
jgi:hypothetical protein